MKRIVSIFILFALITAAVLSPHSAAAEDLGIVGKTYEIEETDLIAHIQAELRAMQHDGRLAEQQQLMRERAQATVARPPGTRLPRAAESRFYHHDPSVTTDFDVVDDKGNVIYAAGTTINPLEYATLNTPIVFFDGDDKAQKEWVRTLIGDAPDNYVPLMTNGPVIELMQEWNIRLYFDQHGRYADQFGITALPAVVRQEGFVLRVDQIALEES